MRLACLILLACVVVSFGCKPREIDAGAQNVMGVPDGETVDFSNSPQAAHDGDLLAIPVAQGENTEFESSLPGEPPDVKALVVRWSQPELPLQLTKIFTGRLAKPSHVALSSDGQLLYVANYATAKHRIYQTSDGKKLMEFVHGDAPLLAANISPDGKFVVSTLQGDRVSVWDVKQQKEVCQHRRLPDIQTLAATSSTTPRLIAGLADGRVVIHPLMEDKGKAYQCEDKGDPQPEYGVLEQKVELAVSADGRMVFCSDPNTPGVVSLLCLEETGFASITNKTETSVGGPLAAGKYVYAETLSPSNLRVIHRTDKPTDDWRSRNILVSYAKTRILSVSPADDLVGLIRAERDSLDIFSVLTGSRKACKFPRGERPLFASFHWPSRLVATWNFQNELAVYRMDNIRFRFDEIEREIHRCLQEKNDQRLLAIHEELSQDPKPFSGLRIDSSKQVAFLGQLLSGPALIKDVGGTAALNGFFERNANEPLVRMCRAEQAISAGSKARGEGYANTVSAEGWRIYHQKLTEAEKLLEPLRQEPVIPPHAYSLIFAIAKGESWSKGKTDYYLERLWKEHPRYLPAHAAYMEGLMPRWGGEPGECEAYAAKVADSIGGLDGDAAYATLVARLINYGNHGIVDELGFDTARFQQGIDHRFRDDPNSAQYWQLAMMMAFIAGDGSRAKTFANKIAKRGDPYAGHYCNEDIFDRVLSKTLNSGP